MSTTQAVEIPEGYLTPEKFFEGIEGQLQAHVNGALVIALNHTGEYPNERLHFITEDGAHYDDLRNANNPDEYGKGWVFTITVRMISDPPVEQSA